MSDKERQNIENRLNFYSSLLKEKEREIQTVIIKRKIVEDINLEIFVEISDKIIVLILKNDNIFYKEENLNIKFENQTLKYINEGTLLSKLFYNIIVNYSFYGLNSLEFDEEWIETIFHKNDGYQTPIVLNPMRTDGCVDINKETSLTKQRFLYNLILNNSLKLDILN